MFEILQSLYDVVNLYNTYYRTLLPPCGHAVITVYRYMSHTKDGDYN